MPIPFLLRPAFLHGYQAEVGTPTGSKPPLSAKGRCCSPFSSTPTPSSPSTPAGDEGEEHADKYAAWHIYPCSSVPTEKIASERRKTGA